jgi:glycosyltransferase involved in cell wall biosynthesis/ribosomal protein S18 acetylase RimI-like enzyme
MEAAVSDPIRVAHVASVDITHRFLLFDQLRRLRDAGFDVTAISAPGPWALDLRAEGIRVVPWRHITRAWDPGADALAFVELVRILSRGSFDLVHTHNPKPGVLGRLAARAAGVPCVVNTVHGLYATPEDGRAKRTSVAVVERLAARLSDLELYQSAEDLEWSRAVGIVRRRQGVLLGNGVDLTAFRPTAVSRARASELRRELGIGDGAPVVGMVGRIVAEKGYREFFSAADAVQCLRPGVRFVVVGEPDTAKRDAIRERELSAAGVIVAGWRRDVRELLAIMDVFVLPSWREGLPRSAIEAAAMGRAIVLSDVRGCREVAVAGREALFVPPRDARRVADAIIRLIDDPGLRATLGRAARRRAEQRFDARRVGDLILSSYADVLRRKGLVPSRVVATGVQIRRARPADDAALADLHRELLPTAFLPSLGDGVLRALYRALRRDERSVVLVAEEHGSIVGFAAATASVRRFYRRFVRRHGARAAVLAAPRLIRPPVLRRALETFAYQRRTPPDLPDAELLSIAVDPRSRARGVGAALARAVLEDVARLGGDRVRVVVDAGNAAGNRLYASLGFAKRRQLAVHDGTPSNVWVIEWPSSSLSRSA